MAFESDFELSYNPENLIILMSSKSVLICEDVFVDQRESLVALQEIGIDGAKVAGTIDDALETLREIDRGERPAVGLILLDLVLGRDSGFEVLRLWRTSAQLKKIPVVVWTGVEEPSYRKICNHFGVQSVVMKYEGRKALQAAINTAISGPN